MMFLFEIGQDIGLFLLMLDSNHQFIKYCSPRIGISV